MTARGRRPGDPAQTRAAILAAAREAFAARGFASATIRLIAELADVDPALVLHYFGSKQRLFATAYEFEVDPAEMLSTVVDAPADRRAHELVRQYLRLFTGDHSPGVAFLRSAASQETAATMLREFIESVYLPWAPTLAPGEHSELRMELAATHMLGAMFGRHILQIAPLATCSDDELIALITPAIDSYLGTPAQGDRANGGPAQRGAAQGGSTTLA